MQQINHTLFSMSFIELLKSWHRFQPQYTFSQTFGGVLIVKALFKHRREAGVEAQSFSISHRVVLLVFSLDPRPGDITDIIDSHDSSGAEDFIVTSSADPYK